jgi:Bacterial protein of unknown function (DUF922)
MRLILKKMILAAFVCIGCCQVTSAQYRELTADDFEGAPQSHSEAIAYTHCNIDFRYRVHARNGHYQLFFNIKLNVDHQRSWMDMDRITSDEMLEEVLKHEQGHYIIAYMEQQELLRTLSKTHFGSDYQNRAQQIFDRIDAKYQQLNKDYDQDTQHMNNRRQQISWNKYFQKKLEYLPSGDQG